MNLRKSPESRAGFTLTELMVVIVIIAVLSALAFVGAKRAIASAKMAANTSNLRNVGTIVNSIAQDRGEYPPGWSWTKGESWATVVVRELNGDGVLQDSSLLSPMVTTSIPSDFKHPTVSNYSVSPFIFPQETNNGRGWKVTPSRLRRPGEQILLGDGLPRNKTVPYGFTMIIYWDLLNSGRAGNSGNPPVSNPGRANRVIRWPDNIADMTDDGGAGLPAFRNRGKAHFLFADGHVQAMGPGDLKYKHFAISY